VTAGAEGGDGAPYADAHVREIPEVAMELPKIISVDDHVVEPPHVFEGRLPASLQARAPRIIETSRGHHVWEFEGQRSTQVGKKRRR